MSKATAKTIAKKTERDLFNLLVKWDELKPGNGPNYVRLNNVLNTALSAGKTQHSELLQIGFTDRQLDRAARDLPTDADHEVRDTFIFYMKKRVGIPVTEVFAVSVTVPAPRRPHQSERNWLDRLVDNKRVETEAVLAL